MSNLTTKSQFIAALTEAKVAIPRKAKLEVLQDLYAKHIETPAPATETPVDDFAMSQAELDAQKAAGSRPDAFAGVKYDDAKEMNCPACGIHLSNGLLDADCEVANKPGVTLHMEGMNHEFNCMGCGAEFGDVRAPYVAPATPVPATPVPATTGLKIEKDREERNGVKRPSIGGKCRAIWDALDQHAETTGDDPTSKDVKALAATHGWNPNNASIEFYQWRKFNGIVKAPKAA